MLDFYPEVSAKNYSLVYKATHGNNFKVDGQKVEFEARSHAEAESIQRYFAGLCRQVMIIHKAVVSITQVA